MVAVAVVELVLLMAPVAPVVVETREQQIVMVEMELQILEEEVEVLFQSLHRNHILHLDMLGQFLIHYQNKIHI